jgi:hypothetical protein
MHGAARAGLCPFSPRRQQPALAALQRPAAAGPGCRTARARARPLPPPQPPPPRPPAAPRRPAARACAPCSRGTTSSTTTTHPPTSRACTASRRCPAFSSSTAARWYRGSRCAMCGACAGQRRWCARARGGRVGAPCAAAQGRAGAAPTRDLAAHAPGLPLPPTPGPGRHGGGPAGRRRGLPARAVQGRARRARLTPPPAHARAATSAAAAGRRAARAAPRPPPLRQGRGRWAPAAPPPPTLYHQPTHPCAITSLPRSKPPASSTLVAPRTAPVAAPPAAPPSGGRARPCCTTPRPPRHGRTPPRARPTSRRPPPR